MDAANKIQTIDIDRAAEKLRMDTIIADMHTRLNDVFKGVLASVGVLESKMAECSRGGGEFDGGSARNSRAPRLRVPDPSGWKLKEMAGKEDAWST